MVTRFSSISTRKLSKALTLLTSNKAMVATSDYGNFHRMVKRFILSSVLGSNAQVTSLHHPSAISSSPDVAPSYLSFSTLVSAEAAPRPQGHADGECLRISPCPDQGRAPSGRQPPSRVPDGALPAGFERSGFLLPADSTHMMNKKNHGFSTINL